RIVQLMDGSMSVESVPGAGSTFFFTIKLPVAPASARSSQPPPADLRGLRALIIDDNDTNRRILEELTRRWEMRPDSAASGIAGLAMLTEASAKGLPYHLILLDEHMPHMDGLEVIARVRASSALRGSTIMMLTSADQTSVAARCREQGVETYLIKPI